ncbi:MAG: Uma2 family endonuclease [Burkholderiales bacterium]
MSAVLDNRRLSADEYLRWDADQPDKHEYISGEVIAMVGVTRRHNIVALNLARQLASKLEGTPCRVFISDIKLEVAAANAYFCPDVMVTCDAADLKADQIMHAPTLLVEVLSPSTASYDRGEKFSAYRQIESLREYILIDPDKQRVEGFRRDPDRRWIVMEYPAAAALNFTSLAVAIAWQAVFDGVD